MGELAPNASHHHTELGIKDDTLAANKKKLALPLVGIRQTSFEDGNEIETETDEGGFLNNSVYDRYEAIAKSGVGAIVSEIFALDYKDRF